VAGSLKRIHKLSSFGRGRLSVWFQNNRWLPKLQQFVTSNLQSGTEIRSNRPEAYGVRDEKEACRVQIGHFMGKLTALTKVKKRPVTA
jgi:hypothetical protein